MDPEPTAPRRAGIVVPTRRLIGPTPTAVATRLAALALAGAVVAGGLGEVADRRHDTAVAVAAAEARLAEIARHDRATRAGSVRLTGAAVQYAAMRRAEALSAARAAVLAADAVVVKRGASPDVPAETLTPLGQAKDSLVALIRATPTPVPAAVPTPVPTPGPASGPAAELVRTASGPAARSAAARSATASPTVASPRVASPTAASPSGASPTAASPTAPPTTAVTPPPDTPAAGAPARHAPAAELSATDTPETRVPVPGERAAGVAAARTDRALSPSSDADPVDGPAGRAVRTPAAVVVEEAASGSSGASASGAGADAVAEPADALRALDLAVSAEVLAAAQRLTYLSAQAQAAADAAVAAATAAREAARAAEEAARAEAAALAERVAAADAAPNGQIPPEVLCAVEIAPDALLRCDAARAFDLLAAAYRADVGRDLVLVSSYRSFDAQVAVRTAKGSLAAEPGRSNHGRGQAVDLGGFGGLGDFTQPPYLWMKEHAGKFGWYHPAAMEPGGSGPQEPWHWEFGTEH